MVLSIRCTNYRGEKGLLICGKDWQGGFGASVYVPGRSLHSRRVAQWIKEKMKKREDWNFKEAEAAINELERKELGEGV